MLASETCALDAVGAEFVRDVEPGELVTITKEGFLSNKDMCFADPEKAGKMYF